MTELMLDLVFCCESCDETTYFTVHCRGEGLSAGTRLTAAALVHCFHCGSLHQVAFHPTGEVVRAKAVQCSCRVAVPSRN